MFSFAKAGQLKPLDNVLDMSLMSNDYAPDWVKLGQYNGKTYSIFIKTALLDWSGTTPRRSRPRGPRCPRPGLT